MMSDKTKKREKKRLFHPPKKSEKDLSRSSRAIFRAKSSVTTCGLSASPQFEQCVHVHKNESERRKNEGENDARRRRQATGEDRRRETVWETMTPKNDQRKQRKHPPKAARAIISSAISFHPAGRLVASRFSSMLFAALYATIIRRPSSSQSTA